MEILPFCLNLRIENCGETNSNNLMQTEKRPLSQLTFDNNSYLKKTGL